MTRLNSKSPEGLYDLTNQEIRKWFDNGSAKLGELTRIEQLLNRIIDLELYVKEFMQLDLA